MNTNTTITLSTAAQANVEETGIDPHDDLLAVLAERHTRETLLDECLNCADDDRVQGWREYVDAIVEAAGSVRARSERTTTISSYTDIVTWIANSNPWGVYSIDGAVDQLADALRAADHPNYGADWGPWLDAQNWQTLVESLPAVREEAE